MNMLLLAETAAEADPANGTNALAAILMVLGVLAIMFLVVLSARGKIARRQADRPSAREMIEEVKSRADGSIALKERSRQQSRDAEDLEVGRRLASQLDNKAERIEILLDEARREIERLEGLIGEIGPGESGRREGQEKDQDGELPRSGTPRSGTPSADRHEPIEPGKRPIPSGEGTEDGDGGLAAASEEAGSKPFTPGRGFEPAAEPERNRPERRLSHGAPRPEPEVSLDPLTRAVYELADDGRSSVEIARQLDEQVGKVELILALRPRG